MYILQKCTGENFLVPGKIMKGNYTHLSVITRYVISVFLLCKMTHIWSPYIYMNNLEYKYNLEHIKQWYQGCYGSLRLYADNPDTN